MTFSEGWRDQYNRMLRSHKRLRVAAGPTSLSSEDARDELYHFFQNAFHLRDWLKKDSSITIPATDIESLFSNTSNAVPALQLAADLANGIKHLGLDRPAKTGDKSTAFSNQDVGLTLGVFETVAEFGPPASELLEPAAATAEYRWTVTSSGQARDALDLADEVVAEWEKWLAAQGLL